MTNRVPSRWESLRFEIRNIHLPFIGHRFSVGAVRKRPAMYCGICAGNEAPPTPPVWCYGCRMWH